MAREADEELDITIREEDLDRVHTLHHFDTADGAGHLQLFFAYTGEIANREPDKCAALRFWSLDGLPEPIVGDTADALAQITAGRPLSVVGWPA